MPIKNIFLLKFERLTRKIIPYFIVLLLFIIIIENPFWSIIDLEPYSLEISIMDSVIVFFFVADLIFKWMKTRKIRKFLRLYWIDILAVFPFYLIFRAYSLFLGVAGITETAQEIVHETVLVRESKALEEAKVGEEALKEAKPFSRILRASQRILRAMKGRFYLTYKTLIHSEREFRKKHGKKHLKTS